MPDLGGGGLLWSRLELVGRREGGEERVEGDVEGRGEPEEDELDEEGAVEDDGVGEVALHEGGPGGPGGFHTW